MKKVKKNRLYYWDTVVELDIFIRQLKKLNWHTFMWLEDFLLTSALADFY